MAADEDVVIEGTHGPYAGRRLTVSAKEAKQAISEGWARDPLAPEPAEGEEPKELTDEERAKIVEKAEAAGRRLRGEEEPSAGAAKESKTVEAEDPAEYQTRASKAKK
jgi:hypothetical protein